MGDSDEDYDRRRSSRDKFHKERDDYSRHERGKREEWSERGSGRGNDWRQNNSDRRRDYRDYGNRDYGERRRFSPRQDISPPYPQRMRRDWDDGYHHDGPPHHAGPPPMWSHNDYHGGGGGHYPGGGYQREHDFPTQPRMKSLKEFLADQDDSINEEDALKKYNEYKFEYRKKQINEFFLAHKEEEWFRWKYHPEDSQKRKTTEHERVEKRRQVFMELLDKGWLEGVAVETESQKAMMRLLDAAVILMEDGTDEDLRALEVEYDGSENEKRSEDTTPKVKEEGDAEEGASEKPSEPVPEAAEPAEASTKPVEKPKTEPRKAEKRKRDFAGSDNESISSEEEEGTAAPEAGELQETKSEDGEAKDGDSIADNEVKSEPSEKPEAEAAPAENVLEQRPADAARALHKTSSIFLRNLAPAITKQEVEAVCKSYGGYKRVALADPIPERRFFRRGWATFEHWVNIKDICWKLSNIRLRDCDLGAIINRELTRRVRPTNGITFHKQIVRNDLRLATKIIQTLDARYGLWKFDPAIHTNGDSSALVKSGNPLLKGIMDYLVEEMSAEEEELLGNDDGKEESNGIQIEKDDALLKVLDRLIFYLRIVHSFDFYHAAEYQNEDEMPNRCGIMHARAPPSSVRVSQVELDDWQKAFTARIHPFVEARDVMTEEEAKKLGLKDKEVEVEQFIQNNTQELAKEKWLCPLSGKKFKGPEFVRKHVCNKHGEKLDEVRVEVEYFNSYLMDPKRPQLPDHPGNRVHGMRMDNQMHPPPMPYPGPMRPMWHPMPHYPPYGGRGGYHQDYHRPPPYRGGDGGGGGGRGHDSGPPRKRYRSEREREVINYRDLDAPAEDDMF